LRSQRIGHYDDLAPLVNANPDLRSTKSTTFPPSSLSKEGCVANIIFRYDIIVSKLQKQYFKCQMTKIEITASLQNPADKLKTAIIQILGSGQPNLSIGFTVITQF
tara:strand:+ start:388 stop:705 length:318 start_codon:yes stop_codon:yes gene_type:complete